MSPDSEVHPTLNENETPARTKELDPRILKQVGQ